MITCGIELKGSEALLALASLDAGQPVHLPSAIKKIGIEDDEDAGQVREFLARVQAFVSEHGVTHVAIKKRSKKGDFAGGPVTFKLEGLLQLLQGCEVLLVSPQTIAAQGKKHDLAPPAALNKYQHEAWKSACSVLFTR
ncbi:DUF3010 family protein [Pseudomonas putida CSV86]|uniref:DUF3010 family protein n=1 Tax=Pseudomonas bharatica CSV86 TaxID=1005395 RepID=L1LVP7_9PSED|nr:DUF3010 family protein [Pseudomonas bharatica]NNJ18756.1 DUF3010 family protein [Pseudomonas bharatica CSV86]